jgi:hypothetical protein
MQELALDHLDDRAFPASAPVGARRSHHDAVAVQDFSHFLLAEVEIVSTLDDGETVAVGMPLDARCDEIELGGDENRALAVAQNLAVALHRRHAPFERLALVRPDREPARELFVGERNARLGERLQHEFAASDRSFVARRFAFAVRVSGA